MPGSAFQRSNCVILSMSGDTACKGKQHPIENCERKKTLHIQNLYTMHQGRESTAVDYVGITLYISMDIKVCLLIYAIWQML